MTRSAAPRRRPGGQRPVHPQRHRVHRGRARVPAGQRRTLDLANIDESMLMRIEAPDMHTARSGILASLNVGFTG
jgi:hypothetical protein